MSAGKIVLLGMLSKIPVPGVVWQIAHYMRGLAALGFEPYYVEAHGRTPSMLMSSPADDGAALAAAFIDRALRPFDFGDRWAYQALHDGDRVYGLSEAQLADLYGSAELIINLHGGTEPRPEHSAQGRLVYLETDPGQLQVELAHDLATTVDFLERHCAFFTFAENWGSPDCPLAAERRFVFHRTRQPVCLEMWTPVDGDGDRFTTVGNWRQSWRDVSIEGRVYSWSKHVEFERFLSLPERTGRAFGLALSAYEEEDRRRLEEHGWRVEPATDRAGDAERYRTFVRGSIGEFTVAKEQNVVLRTGWFSDRSASYLAAGRPVVTQETGFSRHLPTGCGLHSFTTLEEAAAAIESITGGYDRARTDARNIAREFFDAETVLGELLATCGVTLPGRTARTPPAPPLLAPQLQLKPESRRPLRLKAAATRHILAAPIPFPTAAGDPSAEPTASVIVVSHGSLPLTRLCLESVLANTREPRFELIVIDNGSSDGSRAYLRNLASRFTNVRLQLNPENLGFAAATNQGLERAAGEVMVLLNNDTIVAPGWLERLVRHAAVSDVGCVGPVTNRIGNEAEVAARYDTYAGFLREAARRAEEHAGECFSIAMPAMFCLALRREVYDRVGALDEGFGLGTLEDDDYAERVRGLGLRLVCAEDVLVHHWGEGSLGRLYADGSYSRLIAANRARFEEKWGQPWQPYARRLDPEYEGVRARVRQVVAGLPPDSAVIVASRGDDVLLRFPDHDGWHFPQLPEGTFAGHYPASSAEAIEQLERLRARGGAYFVLPQPSLWWLEHYRELSDHLGRYPEVVRDRACVVFALRSAA